jgi:hypothetical protein
MDPLEDRADRRARHEELLDTTTTTRIEQLLVRFQPLMSVVTTGCLLHRDYHFENVLQQEGKVTGIIDFEWAMSGDPVFDCYAGSDAGQSPGLQDRRDSKESPSCSLKLHPKPLSRAHGRCQAASLGCSVRQSIQLEALIARLEVPVTEQAAEIAGLAAEVARWRGSGIAGRSVVRRASS